MQIQEYLNKKKEIQEQLAHIGREQVAEVFTKLFQGGGISCIMWTQYAPYFNDGDPCVFSVYDQNYEVSVEEALKRQTSMSEESKEEHIQWHAANPGEFWANNCDWNSPYMTQTIAGVDEAALSAVQQILDCDELCESVFGSDSKVVAFWNPTTKQAEFIVEDYDHD